MESGRIQIHMKDIGLSSSNMTQEEWFCDILDNNACT